MKKISFILLFLVEIVLGKVVLLDNKVANGRCFLLKSDNSGYVAFNGKRYKFFPTILDNSYAYYALVPVSYYTKPHRDKLVTVAFVDGKKRYKTFRVKIIKGRYKSERLRVNPKKAHFSKKARQRIAREYKEAKKIYNTITPYTFWDKPFILPLDTKITSPFGRRRVFNGSLKSYHSGTDFRAKRGTPIISINDGEVVLAKNRFFAGNSVIVNYGEGIYFGYYHLSHLKVKKGDFVKQGQVLGLSGATGRVTGPHLHLSAKVWGVQVDPMQLIKLLNQI